MGDVKPIEIGVKANKLVATWTACGHDVCLTPPPANRWIALGFGDPCPVCTDGPLPEVHGDGSPLFAEPAS